MKNTLIAAGILFGLFAAGCGGQAIDESTLIVEDLCTGEEVGVQDVATGVVSFDDGSALSRSDVEFLEGPAPGVCETVVGAKLALAASNCRWQYLSYPDMQDVALVCYTCFYPSGTSTGTCWGQQ